MPTDNHQHSIGSVAKLTGLTTHTIRKWEDRYNAVSPTRSTGGDRRYSSDDVSRLRMLKELTDAGQAISGIAQLSHEDLIERSTGSANTDAYRVSQQIQLGVVGESLITLFSENAVLMPEIIVVPLPDFTAASPSEAAALDIDVLIIERPSLHDGLAEELETITQQTGVSRIVLLYSFAPLAVAMKFSTDTVACVHTPINYRELQRTVLALCSQAPERVRMEPANPRYSREVLAKVAAISTTIACECPRHISEMIFALVNFEEYSANCEAKNSQDAVLHNYLRLTAATSRVAFETALEVVATHEQIPLGEWQSNTANNLPSSTTKLS